MKIHTKPFSRLSAAQKRIAIAKDVLKQIKVGQYQIQSGTWLDIEFPDPVSEPEQEDYNLTPEETQRLLLGGQKVVVKVDVEPAKCTCCAIGAACASAVRLGNTHAIKDGELFDDLESGMKVLKGYFSKSQCELIEACFEKRTDLTQNDRNLTDKEKTSIRSFLSKDGRAGDQEIRAIAIFENIVKNKGEFKP